MELQTQRYDIQTKPDFSFFLFFPFLSPLLSLSSLFEGPYTAKQKSEAPLRKRKKKKFKFVQQNDSLTLRQHRGACLIVPSTSNTEALTQLQKISSETKN